jgi:hypothetical protein
MEHKLLIYNTSFEISRYEQTVRMRYNWTVQAQTDGGRCRSQGDYFEGDGSQN